MNKINLKHMARLARLHFKEEDLKDFESRVEGILAFVDQLKEVPVDGVEPTSHPLTISNVFREDIVGAHSCAPLQDAIQQFIQRAPRTHKNFFEVPKIIEDKN